MRTDSASSIGIRGVIVSLAIGVCVAQGLAASAQDGGTGRGNPLLGRKIYRKGILPNGELLPAVVNGDVPIRGRIASCAQCHRNSGFGSDEPGKIVPAITGPRLFSPRSHDRGEEIRSLYQEPQTNVEATRVRVPKNRPAYTAASLIASLRDGRSSAGRHFGPLKPRYELSDEDGAHLVAYLKTLGTDSPPGIDAETIHFATIVTDDVPPEQQHCFLEMIEKFVEIRNRETIRYLARPGISPNYKDGHLTSYRRWKVHVWHLEGGRDMYPLQLVTHYQRTPVFAVLGGLSAGDWKPIHRFCEFRGIPNLFPQTPLPEPKAAGGQTLYFDRGVDAEAAALAEHCLGQEQSPADVTILSRSPVLAKTFAWRLQKQLSGAGVGVRLLDWSRRQDLAPAAVDDASELAAGPARQWHVLLLGEDDVRLVMRTFAPQSAADVFLSKSLLGADAAAGLAKELDANLLGPYETPDIPLPRTYRLRSWFHARRIELKYPALQMKTYFMLSVTSHALGHMVGRHSREYLIERIEHETENALNPGIYAHLSLGPGQRFAASEGIVDIAPSRRGAASVR